MPAYSNKWRMGISAAAVVAIAALVGVFYLSVALDHANTQYRNSINHSACGFRSLAMPALARARQASHDQKASPGTRKRSDAQIKSLERFLSTQITVPPSFDCSSLTSPRESR